MSTEIVSPEALEADESTPGIVRETVFERDNNVMVRSRVAADTTTGWHHHGDRHAYGHITQGEGVIEYGPRGRERRELSAPLFFHISPGTVHREISDTAMEVVVNFVGAGPLAVNVERLEAE